MTFNGGLHINGKKWIKMKMKTSICFNNKGNEVIIWCSFSVWLCLFLGSHNHYMCCHCWCSLHHICASQVNNENVHQGLKIIFNDKYIQLSLSVVKEKVGDLPLNMCSILQSNSCDNILKCIVGYHTFTFIKAPKQMRYLDCQWYDHINTMKDGQP